MHLHYPHHGSQIQSCSTRFQNFLSPPRTHPKTQNRAFFSIFYTAAVTYPHVVTLIYWAVLVPNDESTIPRSSTYRCLLSITDVHMAGDKVFGMDWYTEFFVLNKFAINSFIALVEVFFFCSIRRMTVCQNL